MTALYKIDVDAKAFEKGTMYGRMSGRSNDILAIDVRNLTYTTNIFFDICRGFQGIGNAFMLPNAIVLLTNKYNSNTAAGIRRRVIVLTVFGACGSSGNVIGLVFAALLGQFSQWAWTGLTTR